MLQIIARDGIPLRSELVKIMTTSCIWIDDPSNPGQLIPTNRGVSESEQRVFIDDAPAPNLDMGKPLEQICKNHRKLLKKERNLKEQK